MLVFIYGESFIHFGKKKEKYNKLSSFPPFSEGQPHITLGKKRSFINILIEQKCIPAKRLHFILKAWQSPFMKDQTHLTLPKKRTSLALLGEENKNRTEQKKKKKKKKNKRKT